MGKQEKNDEIIKINLNVILYVQSMIINEFTAVVIQ